MSPKQKKQTLKQLGANLAAARIEANLTQARVAKEARLSVAYISLIERGGRNPPATLIAELSRIVGFDAGYLFRKAA